MLEIVIDTATLLEVRLEEPERPALLAATTGAVLLAPASLPREVGNALVAALGLDPSGGFWVIDSAYSLSAVAGIAVFRRSSWRMGVV